MFGDFEFRLSSRNADYRFKIKRKITRITGQSAAGKSELCRLITAGRNPRAGITITCPYPVKVFDDAQFFLIEAVIEKLNGKYKNHDSAEYRNALRDALSFYDHILFFADESLECMNTHEFSVFCKYTDTFFVLISRAALKHLPYSFTEIYEMKASGRFHTLEQVYSAEDFLVFDDTKQIVTEDSNSGFQFMKAFRDDVISAKGKSSILNMIRDSQCILADGAAFGSEMDLVTGYIRENKLRVRLFLPESFEFLLLKALIKEERCDAAMRNLFDKINGLYFSWENYFTQLLKECTYGLYNAYSKSQMNECYIKPCCFRKKAVCSQEYVSDKYHKVFEEYLAEDETAESKKKP